MNNKIPTIAEKSHFDVKPGISSFSSKNSLTKMNIYLRKISSYIKNNVKNNSDLYWYSTAGMRFVPAKEQDFMYKQIKNYLSSYSPVQVKDIRTIPGYEEGALMWLSANYKNFMENSYGIIDIGGASTQISYETNEKFANISISLGSTSKKILSKSFLGFGINEFRKMHEQEVNCFFTEYPMSNKSMATGNFHSCRDRIKSSLLPIKEFTKTVAIPYQMPFKGFDNFSKTIFNSIPHFEGKEISLNTLNQLGTAVCQRKWSEVKKNMTTNTDAFKYCLNLSYFSELLEAYQFPQDKSILLEKGSWTLGKAMIIATHGSLTKLTPVLD